MSRSQMDMSNPGAADDRLRISLEPVPTHLRPVLAALLSGATDAAASRLLSVSPRTFSRRSAELLDYFGVQTRFQAGVKLGLRWRVPVPDRSGLGAGDLWPAELRADRPIDGL